MLYNHVNIDNLAYKSPPVIVSSAEIEAELKPVYDRLNLPSGRLELMSGIKNRRFWELGTKPSDAAIAAGKKALDSASFPIDNISCLIMCSVCRDFLEPATATVVHNHLNLPENAMVFDISNACLGVLTGMVVLASMIELGQIKAGLLVAGENSRSLVETTISEMNTDLSLTRKSIKPYFASLTIGSGATAVLMCHESLAKTNHRLIGETSLAKTCYNDLCQGDIAKGSLGDTETLMRTDSEMLLERGVETAGIAWNSFQRETGWSDENVDCYCTHQVGKAHKKKLFETLNIDLAKDFSTLSEFGNIGSVSCPITLAKAVETGTVIDKSKVALLGIGSGINSTMLGVEW